MREPPPSPPAPEANSHWLSILSSPVGNTRFMIFDFMFDMLASSPGVPFWPLVKSPPWYQVGSCSVGVTRPPGPPAPPRTVNTASAASPPSGEN